MKMCYSKPLSDVSLENEQRLLQNEESLKRQKRIAGILRDCKRRLRCIVCESRLTKAESFLHRQVVYVLCPICGHIQTRCQLPSGYPQDTKKGLSFDVIYPKLTRREYASRKERIYRPKLDWALATSSELGLNKKRMIQKRWVELGCGAGYFLAALKDKGARDILGIENNRNLARIANESLGGNHVLCSHGSLADVVLDYQADIYAAFFVLEHIEDTAKLLKNLSSLPKGTVFIFAVSTFGFASIMENCFEDFWARSLDSVMHTQLFTDASIKYLLKKAGFKKMAEWIFGQDALDLERMLLIHLKRNKYPEPFYKIIAHNLNDIRDSFQGILDRQHFSDSRHIVAVKA